jgi:hypothetical protein
LDGENGVRRKNRPGLSMMRLYHPGDERQDRPRLILLFSALKKYGALSRHRKKRYNIAREQLLYIGVRNLKKMCLVRGCLS